MKRETQPNEATMFITYEEETTTLELIEAGDDFMLILSSDPGFMDSLLSSGSYVTFLKEFLAHVHVQRLTLVSPKGISGSSPYDSCSTLVIMQMYIMTRTEN